MIQMLKLMDKNIKIIMINMLRNLQEKMEELRDRKL